MTPAWSTDTQREQAAVILHLSLMSVYFFICSETVVDGTDDCEMAGQRILSLTEDAAELLLNNLQVLVHLAITGNGRQRSECVPPKNTRD